MLDEVFQAKVITVFLNVYNCGVSSVYVIADDK
jgi:hypothetical protein